MDDAGEIAAIGLEWVQRYYSHVLGCTADLQTDACSTAEAPSPRLKRALTKVHEEVLARYYGCGLIAPLALHGARVLDLGCGSGRDAYMLAQLVGETGSVTGWTPRRNSWRWRSAIATGIASASAMRGTMSPFSKETSRARPTQTWRKSPRFTNIPTTNGGRPEAAHPYGWGARRVLGCRHHGGR